MSENLWGLQHVGSSVGDAKRAQWTFTGPDFTNRTNSIKYLPFKSN